MISWRQFTKPEKRFRLFIYSILFACSLSLLVNEVVYQRNQRLVNPVQVNNLAKANEFKKIIIKNQATIPASVAGNRPEYKIEGVNVPILLYHYVGNNPNPKDLARNALSITPDIFENQMAYLKNNGYTAIGFETLLAAIEEKENLPEKPVILTFDDGYIDFYYNAFPILEKYGFKSTVFVPTGLVGQKAYLTWEMIEQMAATKHVSFQSHGVSHQALAALSNQELMKELVESKRDLESRLDKSVNFIAYPYGSFDGRVISAAKNTGYLGAVATILGTIEGQSNLYSLPRVRPGTGSISEFAKKLNGTSAQAQVPTLGRN